MRSSNVSQVTATSVARLRQRSDGMFEFLPTADYQRSGVTSCVLGPDEAEARRRFERRCAKIAETVEITPLVRFEPAPRAVHPLDRDPNALVARPGPDGWTVTRGEEIVASGLPPYRALDMVREAGGIAERSLEGA